MLSRALGCIQSPKQTLNHIKPVAELRAAARSANLPIFPSRRDVRAGAVDPVTVLTIAAGATALMLAVANNTNSVSTNSKDVQAFAAKLGDLATNEKVSELGQTLRSEIKSVVTEVKGLRADVKALGAQIAGIETTMVSKHDIVQVLSVEIQTAIHYIFIIMTSLQALTATYYVYAEQQPRPSPP